MSRLTNLIAQAKANNPDLGKELEREFRVLSSRRSFGLNFERHTPESVELPGRPIRKGDKVHILPPRGTFTKGDNRLWKVLLITRKGKAHTAQMELVGEEKVKQSISVDDLVVVVEFRDYIYPGLVSTGKVERGGDKPYHTVINGENFHALEALTFTHRGKIDVIYIDPPYNSGAKDWKYNNDYVERDDLYRHSKWLAMMERRLNVARELLNPNNSALIVSIDEKEYLRLGLLLEQTFPEAKIQMVSSVINAKGIIRDNEFSRTNEFIFFVFLGTHRINQELKIVKNDVVRWASLRRSDAESARGTKKGGPEQFYPIYVHQETGKIIEIGRPLKPNEKIEDVKSIPECLTIFPIRDKGDVLEMNWGLTVSTLKERLDKGYVQAVFSGKGNSRKVTIYYLTSGVIDEIDEGSIVINGYDQNGVAQVAFTDGKRSNPTTQWEKESHNAQSHGSDIIRSILPGREFPFPKSLYAVEDALRISVGGKKNAIILDFFSGSGTTAHAVMRLNHQDGGCRQCISITNNEVGAEEQISLKKVNLRPGDNEWEKWGICDYITKPRIASAIIGKIPEGGAIKGDYKFSDEFPMSEGLEENAEFFTLTYETPIAVSHNRAFTRIAPLLWMRAGSTGRRIESLSKQGWDVADTYGLLVDLDTSAEFCNAVKKSNGVKIAYIVTDDDRRFQSVARRLPETVEPVRLYESYLNNFRFSFGR